MIAAIAADRRLAAPRAAPRSGLEVWWDFRRHDPVNDVILDLGPHGRHLALPTGDNRPSLGASGATFDGNDWIDTGTHAIGGVDLFAGAGSYWSLVAVARNPTATAGAVIGRGGSGVAFIAGLVLSNSGDDSIVTRGLYRSIAPAAQAWRFYAAVWTGGALWVSHSGLEGWRTVGAGSATDNPASQRIIIGARDNGASLRLPNGSQVGLVALYSRALSAGEVRRLWSAVRASFGL